MFFQVEDVSVSYGNYLAVQGVSLRIEEKEIVFVIGANGAGKTSLLKTISGLIKSQSGKITYRGKRIDNLKPHQIVKLGISHCPEGRKLFPRLSVIKNLTLGSYLLRDRREIRMALDKVFLSFPILEARKNQLAGTLSGGEQQMVAVGRALMANPKLLFLDEPSLGLAPLVIQSIFESIRNINEDGVTVLLVEQNASMAFNISKRGYVMEAGEIVLSGSSAELERNERIKSSYLGG
jgi:branched-chain amino acid transport system ATP-binding protein